MPSMIFFEIVPNFRSATILLVVVLIGSCETTVSYNVGCVLYCSYVSIKKKIKDCACICDVDVES